MYIYQRATPDEEWAMARCLWPMLDTRLHRGAREVSNFACKADGWDHLVTILATADLPIRVFDVAVEILFDVAGKPCACDNCVAASRAADRAAVADRKQLPPASPQVGAAGVMRIRSRYDQTGRFRVRMR